MDRGRRTQLSPNEASTLERIMSGVDQDNFRVSDLAQLVTLQLIEPDNGVWLLTEMGVQHLARERKLAE